MSYHASFYIKIQRKRRKQRMRVTLAYRHAIYNRNLNKERDSKRLPCSRPSYVPFEDKASRICLGVNGLFKGRARNTIMI